MVVLTGGDLTVGQVVQVARGRIGVTLSDAARGRMRASRELVGELARQAPVYGRTTGVGALREVAVDPAAGALREVAVDPAGTPQVPHGLRLLRSHAAGAGPLLPAEQVRAMLLVRANQLAAGGAGVAPELADALVACLAADALPAVHSAGAIGTGDLTALAETALTLLGERPWPGPPGPRWAADPSDALALLSSNAATVGEAALAAADLAALADSALVVAALSFTALRGNPGAYAARVHAACPHPGAVEVARRLRGLLSPGAPPARLQDPFGLRLVPQAHGPALEALAALDRVLAVQLNAAAENPLVSLADGAVHAHGGFATYGLALALDAARAAVAASATLGLSRLTDLAEPHLTGLSAFLADGPPGSSGTMALEYTAAAALAEVRLAAAPCPPLAVALSNGLETGASSSTQSARATTRLVPAYRLALAVELVVAVRALRLRGEPVAAPALAAVLERAAAALPAATGDRDQAADLDEAVELIPRLAQWADLPAGTGSTP